VIETMDCAEARISLGVYVVGALDPAERAVVDGHLTMCDGCQAELADLASLPALLASVSMDDAVALDGGLPQESATPLAKADDRPASGAVRRPAGLTAARARRKSRRVAWVSVAAAAAIVVAALSGTELGVHEGRAGAGPYAGPALGPWQAVQGANPAGMHAVVRYRPMGWGTQVAVRVSGVPLHTPCAIEAFAQDGTTTVAGSWITDGNEGKVWYTAGTGIRGDSVTKFVVTVAGHPATTITIPA
jgi:anti-sigma factor RsiW